ncbi:MAG: hypothetical protein NVS3B25_19850 [Hymenobacter sp.]
MPSAAPLLTAEDLAVGYAIRQHPPRPVAGPLSVALWPGELVCLLGPNGAGKSTLLRTLAGLQPPLAGQLRVGGAPLTSLGALERARHISIVLTDRLDAGHLTVRELVTLGRHPHTGWLGGLTAHDHAHVRAALAATGTTAFAARPVGEFSDGERQKVMLARALAQDTPLVLLDEPTAHLDLPNRVPSCACSTSWPAPRARPSCSQRTSWTWPGRPPTGCGCCRPTARCAPAPPKTWC